jgi:glycosyltransferase involved in cell wall biosynthesis
MKTDDSKSQTLAMPKLLRPCIYIDVQDLVEYISHNTTYSGIQRVAAQLLKYAYSNPDEHVAPVLPRVKAGDMQLLPFDLFIGMLKTIEDGTATRASLDEALAEIMETSNFVHPRPGETYFIPGAFWIYENHDHIVEWKKLGVFVALFIHDLIQISHPEYVNADVNRRFLRSFVNMVPLVDHIITNSEYVADDVRNFIKDYVAVCLPKEIPIAAAPLATELPVQAEGKIVDVSSQIRRIASEPYVLCVGTMEIRKNNLYLVKVWEELRRQLGSNQMPNLIYVGKKGWDNDLFFDYVERRGYLDNWVFLFERISDVDLSYLYEHCAFTAYVSFAEGWGLPVGESLVHGKLCVTSNVTSMPEVGGEFAAYVNPYDVRSGISVFGDLLKDAERVKAAEQKICDHFKVKTWTEFSSEVFGFLNETRLTVLRDVFCRIPAGVTASVGDKELLRLNAEKRPLINGRMARTSGWQPIEDWGCWAAKREALLEFASDLMPGQKVRLYLDMTLPGDMQTAEVIIKTQGIENQNIFVTRSQAWYACDMIVNDKGNISLSFVSVGKPYGLDGRGCLYFGLRRISYRPYDDIAARVAFLESNNGVRDEVIILQTTETSNKQNQNPSLEIGDERDFHHTPLRSHDALAVMFSVDDTDITIGQLGLFRWLRHNYHLARARENSRARNWKHGARHYAALIRNGTMTAKSWVQYGHMLNEQGQLTIAAAAYAAGYYLLPDDEDVRWHYENSIERLKKNPAALES